MKEYSEAIHIRWSDLDPNFHVRHSVYYDWAAQIRTQFIVSHGLTPAVMQKHQFGPVLFREEALFKRELKFGDNLLINCMASKLRKDYSRFSMRHHITRGDKLCAVVNIDGAWINTQTRKLTAPPKIGITMVEAMPRTEDFEWV